MLRFVRANPMPDIPDLELVSSAPLNLFLNPASPAARCANFCNVADLYSLQSALAGGRLPRQRLNRIVCGLPVQLARLVRARSLINVDIKYALISSATSVELTSTKIIKQALINQALPNLGVDLNRIHRRHDLPNIDSALFSDHCRILWRIKLPALRAIRLKLCYKDVFSNERRHRFGIADSPSCTGCGLIESVEHQLHGCLNAKRLWQMYKEVTGLEIRSICDLILCTSSIESEILKSAIIKSLIQIDRCHGVPTKVVAQECSNFLRTEAIVDRTREATLLLMINKLNDIP